VSDQRSSNYGGGRRGGDRRDRSDRGDRGDRDDRGDRGDRGDGGRRSFYTRPRTCSFCDDKSQKIDYKNYDMLRRYVHEDGKIRPRRQTGNCAKHQRKLALAIKRARHLALLPFTGEVLR
jgi:small subunit ribosomal protein S18